MYLFGVRAAEVRSFYKPLTLSTADRDRRERVLAFAEVPQRHQHRLLCLALSSGDHMGYVLCAGASVVAEPEGQQPERPGLEPLPDARLLYLIHQDSNREHGPVGP